MENKTFGCFTYEGEGIAWVEPFVCVCGKSSVRVVPSYAGPITEDGLNDLPLCFDD